MTEIEKNTQPLREAKVYKREPKMIKSQLVRKAYDFAKGKHQGQCDDTGQSYFDAHVMGVYELLKMVSDDENLLCAALLHDTLEDTDATYEKLVEEFNRDIADLVMEVSHEGQKDNVGYYFPRLHSERGILLKFADRLSNLSRMESWNEKRREQYLRKSKFWRSENGEKND